MAAAIVERSAERQFDIVLRTADVIAAGRSEAACCVPVEDRIASIGDDLAGAVVVLVEAIGRIETNAFEVGVHDEVDNTGHSVGTVGCRSTAGQNFDALDERSRDLVKVGCGNGGIARLQAAAVDQDQRTRRAETAKVDRGRTRSAVGDEGVLAADNLRQRVDQIFDADRTGVGDFGRTDDGDRAGAVDIGTRDTRTGNDDRPRRGCRRIVDGRFVGRTDLGHCRLRKQGKAKGSGCRTCFEVGVEFHSVNPSIDRPTPEVGSPRNPWEGCDIRNRQSTKSISTPSSGSWHVPLGTRRMQSFCYILAGLRLKVWCAGHTSCLAEIARLRRRSTHRENKAARIA